MDSNQESLLHGPSDSVYERRYEVWAVRPEGNHVVSRVDDLAVAKGDADAYHGEVYDTVNREWVAPDA